MKLSEDEADVIMCEHEAAHAVANWLQGHPAGEMKYDGAKGACETCNTGITAQDAIVVLLAGHAWCFGIKQFLGAEFNVSIFLADTRGKSADDTNLARTIIEEAEVLREGSESIQESMERHFDLTCRMLKPHGDLIEILGEKLNVHRDLSPQMVAATLQEWGNREEQSKKGIKAQIE